MFLVEMSFDVLKSAYSDYFLRIFFVFININMNYIFFQLQSVIEKNSVQFLDCPFIHLAIRSFILMHVYSFATYQPRLYVHDMSLVLLLAFNCP
jgi:hypothetical protein